MQKGHPQSIAPILLLSLVAIVALSLIATGASAQNLKGLIPLAGVSKDPAGRPVIGSLLPKQVAAYMGTKGSGPDPDQNLTATGTASQELSPNGSPGSSQNRIVFSSNGADLLTNGTATTTPDGKIDPVLPANANYNLWIMRSDGSDQYMLANLPGDQVDPSYDPSGRLIVYSSAVNGVWQIFTIEIRDPSIVHQITTGPGNKRHPTWSPDSAYIAFQCDVNGSWDLYKILATGAGSISQMTFGAADDTDPAWSPNGLLVAFTRDNGTVKRIYACDTDGGNITLLSNGGGDATANDQEPAWRQNSQELAFASDRLQAGDSIRNHNVYRMPAQGEANAGIPTLVSDTSILSTADNVDPSWTVDIDRAPTRVVFVSTRSGQPDIWAMQNHDWLFPVLNTTPTVTPRQALPGNEVTISVPVYDQDSGVKQVIAFIKDPDQKTWVNGPNGMARLFEPTTFMGIGFLELDCARVGQVELFDDTNSGVFSAAWPTPAAANGHDYIVDIQVTDNAGNTIVYDDVYGFSTRMFAPHANILFVDDYCEGQLFPALLGYNNAVNSALPVESYYTRNPGNAAGNEDYDTIKDSYGENYDTWRIICRGPVPQSVYQYYLPTVEYQLDPAKITDPTAIADRAVPVADRAIIWAAPHAGNVWVADGSLIAASTQADLASFIKRGGRMFISGEDIAWALTLAGTRSNAFLANTLHAQYVSDCPTYGTLTVPGNYFGNLGRNFTMENTAVGFGLTGLGGDPVSFDAWTPSQHTADNANWGVDDSPLLLHTNFAGGPYADAALVSVRPDLITPVGSTKIYSIFPNEANNTFDPATPGVGVRWEDTSVTNGGKVVYLSFGFEQIHRWYVTSPVYCRNKRSHLMHNAMCWERTGGLQGQVLSVSDGMRPVNDPAPVVTVTRTLPGGIKQIYAVRCQKDGTYITQGLPPGRYDIDATRAGYEISHYEGEWVHGGQYPRIPDLKIYRAQPGAVTGTVTAAADGRPIANVVMSIAPDPDAVPPLDPNTPVPTPVQTAADGSYTLPYIPAGAYIVTADGQPVLYSTKTQTTTINPGDTTSVDFALDAANGTLQAAVTDVDTSAAIDGAAITATDSRGARSVGYTDNTGQASLTLAPGTYTVVVSAAGYRPSDPQSVLIEPAATYSITVALQHQPGGSILGRVVGAGSGTFLGGVTIHVFFGNTEIASTESSATAITTVGGIAYNYSIPAVDTGDVTVTAERTGFTAVPSSRAATIVSGQATRDVNFQMQALFTFPKGLQLVSFPADYSAIDPAVLLGISNPSDLKIATWESTRQRYRIYPDAPADHFRIGVGYWMNLASPADLSDAGTPASDPVAIPLEAGWNLVGCPYNALIDFYTVRVRDMNNVTYTLQQSLSQGILASGLYAYVLGGYQPVGVLSHYTGYWLKTTQPCSLIISATTGAMAVGGTRDATPKPANGWVLPLQTTCAGITDASTFVGAAQAATAGCDFGTDQPKPPLPAMGQYVYTTIDNHDWANYGGNYAVDVRPSGVKSVWNLNISTNMVGQKVRLAWGDMSSLPRDVRPMLVDLDSGKQVYMRTTSAYVFTAKDASRRLQIIADPSGAGALLISPLAASSTAAGTAISYTLSQAATVEITVSNIAGRAVRLVSSGQVQPAGQNVVLWDGRDRNGVQVPDGRYLISITGKTDTGQQARTIMPLVKTAR